MTPEERATAAAEFDTFLRRLASDVYQLKRGLLVLASELQKRGPLDKETEVALDEVFAILSGKRSGND